MSKPKDIPQEVWDAVLDLPIQGEGFCDYADLEVIARAILAAKAEDHRDLVDCLSDMTEHYVELAGCGDCGFWDPEQEIEVIAVSVLTLWFSTGSL